MVTIENLKNYISSQEYQNLIEAVNLSFNNLENDCLQILNIYSSLMNKLQIEIDDFELITSNKEHFFRYYEAFELHAECIEKESVQDDEDDDIEECDPYKSILIPYMTEFIALSKSKDLLIKHHRKNDPKGYKLHLSKLFQLFTSTGSTS